MQKNATKSKSVHDVIDDPKLSKEPVKIDKRKLDDEKAAFESDDEDVVKEKTARVRDKLKNSSKPNKAEKKSDQPQDEPKSDSDSDEFTNELERERKLKRQKKA